MQISCHAGVVMMQETEGTVGNSVRVNALEGKEKKILFDCILFVSCCDTELVLVCLGPSMNRGYVDDPQNTDNTRKETKAVNHHDENIV